MANYQESPVTGTQYTRCRCVEVVNNYGKTPSVVFHEERVRVFGAADHIREPLGQIILPYDGARQIELIHPITGVPLGLTASWQDMYVMLYSAYLGAATARDAEEVARRLAEEQAAIAAAEAAANEAQNEPSAA